jgi:hypothetical protein
MQQSNVRPRIDLNELGCVAMMMPFFSRISLAVVLPIS